MEDPLRCNGSHNFKITLELYWGQSFIGILALLSVLIVNKIAKRFCNTVTDSRFNYQFFKNELIINSDRDPLLPTQEVKN